MKKLPIVGVMGSGEHPHEDLAKPLGALLASLPVHLLTGAGQGVMGAVSRAFASVKERAGLSIGVVPAESLDHPTRRRPGYPNAHVEIPIFTHLVAKQPNHWDGLTRNHINILTANAVVVLPGSVGTAHEVELCVRYGRPAAAYFHTADEMNAMPETVRVCLDIAEVEAFLRATLKL